MCSPTLGCGLGGRDRETGPGDSVGPPLYDDNDRSWVGHRQASLAAHGGLDGDRILDREWGVGVSAENGTKWTCLMSPTLSAASLARNPAVEGRQKAKLEAGDMMTAILVLYRPRTALLLAGSMARATVDRRGRVIFP